MNEILILFLFVFCFTTLSDTQAKENKICPVKTKKKNWLVDCKTCGLSSERSANISGTKSMEKYPWMISFVAKGSDEPFCGGALLNRNFVLTAGHCIWKYVGDCGGKNRSCVPSDDFWVRLPGPQPPSGVQSTVRAASILLHPAFEGPGKAHDIALVRTARPIRCSSNANPICLPKPGVVLKPGQVIHITGFGVKHLTKLKPKPTKGLQEGLIKVARKKRCMAMGFDRREMDTFYCMTGYKNQTPCFGDSGGSMFGRSIRNGGNVVTIGVASLHSSSTCDCTATVLYTSVERHLPWIKEMMADESNRNKTQKRGKTRYRGSG